MEERYSMGKVKIIVIAVEVVRVGGRPIGSVSVSTPELVGGRGHGRGGTGGPVGWGWMREVLGWGLWWL